MADSDEFLQEGVHDGGDDELMACHNRLEAAVKEFNALNQKRTGVVTAFVLFTASNRFDDSGDMLFAYDYMIGLGADMMRAIGLVEMATMRMKTDINNAYEGHDLRHDGNEDD